MDDVRCGISGRSRDVTAGSLSAQPLQPVAANTAPPQLGDWWTGAGSRWHRRLSAVVVVVFCHRGRRVELQPGLCQQLAKYPANVDVIFRRHLHKRPSRQLTLWRSLLLYGYSYKPSLPDLAKPSFVIFDIRALWRSVMSVRVPGCQKLQMTA